MFYFFSPLRVFFYCRIKELKVLVAEYHNASSVVKMLVCLFIWVYRRIRELFHSYEGVTITGEGIEILTYARHLWPLSSEGSLAFYTYCDTGPPFMMVIYETRDTHAYNHV